MWVMYAGSDKDMWLVAETTDKNKQKQKDGTNRRKLKSVHNKRVEA